MAVGKCEQCGVEEYMPFVCKFCHGRYCASHRLPENHGCEALEDYKARARSEGGPWIRQEQSDFVTPQISRRASASAKLDELVDRLQGRAAQTLLAVIGGVFVLQLLVSLLVEGDGIMGYGPVEGFLFVLSPTSYLKPWTIVTSIFAHGGFNHFLINALVFYFFGPTVERLIGTRRFLKLFFLGGIIAGLTQVIVFSYVMPFVAPAFATNAGVVGASGSLMAIFGTLTVLAPKIRVLLFFVIPVPLWIITIGYAFLDTLGLFAVGDGVAHLAHLAGLAFGLAYGKKLHDEGLRVRMAQPSAGSMFGRSF